MTSTLTSPESLHFRDRLRDARAQTLEDAEDFVAIVQVLEDLGKLLKLRCLLAKGEPIKLGHGLGAYTEVLKALAAGSDYAALASQWPYLHTDFDGLLRRVREGRNEAVHQGVFARHLAESALELSLLLEDALMMNHDSIQNFMVRSVVLADGWQPLSFIRLTMLKNSFSYLPVKFDGTYKFIGDLNLAIYLNRSNRKEQEERLLQTLDEAHHGGLTIEAAYTCAPETPRQQALANCKGGPILVVDDGHLLGIVTPFDLL